MLFISFISESDPLLNKMLSQLRILGVMSGRQQQLVPRRLYKKVKKPLYISLQGEVLYGAHPVQMALSARRRTIHCLYYNPDSDRAEQVLDLFKDKGVPCMKMDRQALTDICSQADRYKEHHVHQGMVADVSKLYHYPMDYTMPQITQPPPLIPDRPAHGPHPVWLLLCSIKDPYNLGTIIRTAYFLGVERVVVTGPRCDLTCTVSKASAGTLEVMPVFAVRDAPQLLVSKVEEGWRVLAAAMPGEREGMPDCAVSSLSLACPTVLVLGSEGGGIPPEVMSCVTQGVFVSPGVGVDSQVDSLNVSVAAAIVLHKLCSYVESDG